MPRRPCIDAKRNLKASGARLVAQQVAPGCALFADQGAWGEGPMQPSTPPTCQLPPAGATSDPNSTGTNSPKQAGAFADPCSRELGPADREADRRTSSLSECASDRLARHASSSSNSSREDKGEPGEGGSDASSLSAPALSASWVQPPGMSEWLKARRNSALHSTTWRRVQPQATLGAET